MQKKSVSASTQSSADSITFSMPFSIEKELGLNDLFCGEMTHLAFDCPKNLRRVFKQVTRDNGSSVCKELQKYMVSYIASNMVKKHAFGNDLSRVLKPEVTIENLNFEQYVQSRPRRLVRKEVVEEVDSMVHCHYCRELAVGKAQFLRDNKVYDFCLEHLDTIVHQNPQAWKRL